VKWPSGVVQTLEHVPADQILTITESGERQAVSGAKR